jgi:hypothetical protein
MLSMRHVGSLMLLAAVFAACGSEGTSPAPEKAAESAASSEAGTVESPAVAEASRTTPADVPTYREVTLPAGTTLLLELKSAVGSDSSRVEDSIRGELRRTVVIKGAQVLPAGTELAGTVTSVERAGRVRGLARVALRFDSLRHNGEQYRIQTATIARQGQATKREDATKIAIGAGAGAALGAILGGGDGAAKGAAIGGAGGTGVVLATRGREVRLGPGADLTTRLTAPVTIRVRQ